MPTDPNQPAAQRPIVPDPGPIRTEDTLGALGTLGVAALALLTVLCCAGPALLTAGVLGAVGAWLASPWLIAGAVAVGLAATGWQLRRRVSRRSHSGRSPRPDPIPPSPPIAIAPRPTPTRSVER